MSVMIYEADNQRIDFDDFVDNTAEYGNYWVEMCDGCKDKYQSVLMNQLDDGGTARGTCSVLGCNNEANYYVDFNVNKVRFDEVD